MAVQPFVISRTFPCSLGTLYQAWTDWKHLKTWWGPKGSKLKAGALDFRVGGLFLYCLEYNGEELWGKFIYREIVPNEKLVWVNSFSDERGMTIRHPMNRDWPLEMLTTVSFAGENETATVTVNWLPEASSERELAAFEAGRSSMQQGWSGSLDQLDEHLKTMPRKVDLLSA